MFAAPVSLIWCFRQKNGLSEDCGTIVIGGGSNKLWPWQMLNFLYLCRAFVLLFFLVYYIGLAGGKDIYRYFLSINPTHFKQSEHDIRHKNTGTMDISLGPYRFNYPDDGLAIYKLEDLVEQYFVMSISGSRFCVSGGRCSSFGFRRIRRRSRGWRFGRRFGGSRGRRVCIVIFVVDPEAYTISLFVEIVLTE